MHISDLASELNQNGVEFLKTDVDTGLTFASIALDAGNDLAKKERNRANARKAYDTVVAWSRRLALAESDAHQLEDKLAKLKTALCNLGEEFKEN